MVSEGNYGVPRQAFGYASPDHVSGGLLEMQHLLKVSASIAKDAHQVWAEVFEELRQVAGKSGMVYPEASKGFVPACGWPEFLEKLWLLKHYLDSIQRVCKGKH